LKFHRNAWAAGALTGPHGGSLQHSPRLLARLRGPTSKGEERVGRKGRERKGKGGKVVPPLLEESYAPVWATFARLFA